MSQRSNDAEESVDNAALLDELLLGVIKIEKKHLYGKEQTSTKNRRDEIYKYLTKNLVGAGK